MSYTLHVWEQPAGAPFPSRLMDALDTIDALLRERMPGDSKFPVFAARLTARHPCICTEAGRNSPAWSEGPLDGNADSAVYVIGLHSDRVGEVQPFVVAEARALGLNVMDEQTGQAYLANGKVLS